MVEVKIVRDEEGKSRKYGFVQMENKDDAARLLSVGQVRLVGGILDVRPFEENHNLKIPNAIWNFGRPIIPH